MNDQIQVFPVSIPELIIVSPINPFDKKPGGTRIYIMNLISSMLTYGISVVLIGISKGENRIQENFKFVSIAQKEKISNYMFLVYLLLKAPFFDISNAAIIHAQRPDMLLPFVLFFKNNIKVCTLHGPAYKGIFLKRGVLIGTIYHLIEKFTLRRSDAIIAVSDETKNTYLQKYPWLKGKIKVISVGIDENLFRPMDKNRLRSKYGFSMDDKIMIYVGRFEKEKRLDILLNVFKMVSTEVNNTKLILVGEGREKKNIEVLINNLELKDVKIMDTLPHEKVVEIMNCSDVFVLSSMYEGMPTVVLEALACGVPVVSTNVGDIHKVVKNDVTGYVVKNNNSNEMKNKILNILLSKNSFKDNCILVAQDYSWSTILKRTAEVYAACKE